MNKKVWGDISYKNQCILFKNSILNNFDFFN